MLLLLCLTASLYPAQGRQVQITDALASSPADTAEARKAADGDMSTRWSSQPMDAEWITFTLSEPTVINRIVIHWEAAYAQTYQVQVSRDGEVWYVAKNVGGHRGGLDDLAFEPVLARYVRVWGLSRGTEWGFSILECDIYASDDAPISITSLPQPTDFNYGSDELSPHAFYYHLAAHAPAGRYLPWHRKEQAYWTMSGARRARQESLVSEYGTVDTGTNGFSVTPYLYVDGNVVGARDADSVAQRLENGYLPVPSVTWKCGALEFDQTVFTYGSQTQS